MSLFAINERYIMDIDDEDDDSRISKTDIAESDWYDGLEFPHTTEDNDYKYKFVVRIHYERDNGDLEIAEYYKNLIEYFDSLHLFGNDYAYGNVDVRELNNKVNPIVYEQPLPKMFLIKEWLGGYFGTAVIEMNIYFNKLKNFASYEQFLKTFVRIHKSYRKGLRVPHLSQWSGFVHFEVYKRNDGSEKPRTKVVNGWETISYEWTPLYMPNDNLKWVYQEFFKDRDDWSNGETTSSVVLKDADFEKIMDKATVIAEKQYGIKLTPIAYYKTDEDRKSNWSWMSFDFSPIDSSIKKMDVLEVEECIMNSVCKFIPHIYLHFATLGIILRSTVNVSETLERRERFGRNEVIRQHDHKLDVGDYEFTYYTQAGKISKDGKKQDFKNVRRMWFHSDDSMCIMICNKNGQLSRNDSELYFPSEYYCNVSGTNQFVRNRIVNGVVWGK